jgi:GntR family transcriptional repressor for pyruvate dehydrogenase complex
MIVSQLQAGDAMSKRPLSAFKKVRSKIRPIAKLPISEEIAQQVMDLISNGDLKAGEGLPSERELCKDFGCGRSSLREALRCLSILGVLNARVGEGTSVAVDGSKFLGKIVEWRLITEKHDIENLLEVRMALEGVSAGKAALIRSQEDLAKLEALVARMEGAMNDAKRFAVLDLEFHIALAKAADNALLFDLISMIRGQLVRALTTVLILPHALTLSYKEHTAILNAVKRSDAEAARKAMHAHLGAALKRYNNAVDRRIIVRDKRAQARLGKA